MSDTVESINVEGVAEAFSTTDFDFTAYALTIRGDDGKIVARIAGVKPFRRVNGPGPNVRFAFQLARTNGLPCYDFFNKMLIDYTNRRCTVEPIAFVTQRKQIRVLIDQERLHEQRLQKQSAYTQKKMRKNND